MDARPQIVIDTNVIIAALRSHTGSSSTLLARVFGGDEDDAHLSLPLFLQYRAVIARNADELVYEAHEVRDILEWIASRSTFHNVYFLWRPLLPDPDDDMVAELAIAVRADFIVTHNVKDFREIAAFGIRVVTPVQYLQEVGASL